MSTARTYKKNVADQEGFICSTPQADWQEPDDSELYRDDKITRSARKGDPDATDPKKKCADNTDIGTVLQTNGHMNVMPAGVSYWVNKSKTDSKGLDSSWLTDAIAADTTLEVPAHAIVDAYWQNADVLKARGIKLDIDDKEANIFGAVGMLRVAQATTFIPGKAPVQQLKIPTAPATEENARFYGCSLIPQWDLQVPASVSDVNSFLSRAYAQVMQIASGSKIALMNYTYHAEYVDGYLTQPCGGGGYFVEHHDFPHIHMPLDDSAGGYIIIGKPLATCSMQAACSDGDDPDAGYTKTRFAFTAFQIPYGFALYTPSNTLHGDGTLVGNYGITVASSYTPADTVLFRTYDQTAKKYTMLLDLLEIISN